MQLVPLSWSTRISSWYRGTTARLQRSLYSGLAALRRRPTSPGVSSGRVAASPQAEGDLRSMAESPQAFAALSYLAYSFTSYPIRVYQGWSVGERNLRPLPSSRPFVSAFLRLLQTPDPLSADDLAPEPGEALIAQIVADLRAAGVFYVAPTLSDSGLVIGLKRLHPGATDIRRKNGVEWVVHRAGGDEMWYPRRKVFVGHLLSWSVGGDAELGVGAGTPLRPLLQAEGAALSQTAMRIKQGGGDVVLTPTSAAGAAIMKHKATREKLVEEAVSSLEMRDGRRVYAIGAEVQMKDDGLKPADLQAPQLLDAARGNILAAVGVVPAALGTTDGSYATAVQQMRSQAQLDANLASVIEGFFLRPLVRHFARHFGTTAVVDEITASFDLTQHPGNAHGRTEALKRVQDWIAAGWTNEQAAAMEGMDAPAPKGQVDLSKGAQLNPGPAQGSTHGEPRNPVGDGGGPKNSENQPKGRLDEWFPTGIA